MGEERKERLFYFIIIFFVIFRGFVSVIYELGILGYLFFDFFYYIVYGVSLFTL